VPRRNYREGERKREAFLRRERERELREVAAEVYAEQAARRHSEADSATPDQNAPNSGD